MPEEFIKKAVSRRRRFMAMAIDWIIIATCLLVIIVIYLVVTQKIDPSDWWNSFYTQYEAILDDGYWLGVGYLIYDSVCDLLFHRTLGQMKERIFIVQTKQIPFLPLLRRLFRGIGYNSTFYFLLNGFVLLFIYPYKTIEDHVFGFKVIDEDELVNQAIDEN